jgi:hypothetical protein
MTCSALADAPATHGSQRLQQCFNDGRGGSGRTECGHELCAESVSIVPAQLHPSIRTAANPGARCSENEIGRDPLTQELAAFSSGPRAACPEPVERACPEPVEGSRSPLEHERAGSFGFAQDRRSRSGRCRPQDGNVGGAAIFPRVVSRRSFLLWPCRRRLSSCGGSQPLTPGSGAWLFPDCHFGSIARQASTARFSRHALKRVAESAETPSDADSTDVFAALSPAVSD